MNYNNIMERDDTLKLILLEGEGYKIEFKERISNLDREIVAFANANGGSIFLGVNDSGEPFGIKVTNSLKSQITDIARNCDPSIKIKLVHHQENKILEIQVEEGHDKPYRCTDGFFLRIGPNSQKLKRDEIVNFINTAGKVHFDAALNNDFKFPKDFSETALKDYLKISGIKTKLPAREILISLDILNPQKKLSFSNAGILFFGKSPQKFFPEAYITGVRYQSQDRLSIIDNKDFKGTLIQQIEGIMDFLLRHMSVAANISKSSVMRHDIYDYPPVALREAIVNAVTHRDYFYDGSHIYVHMFPDHIDIENPGGLYHGLTLENLGKRSIRRNRLIADLLHRSKYIERVGSGFDRMKNSLAENNNPPLEVSATNFFNIRFHKRALQTEITSLTERQIQIYNSFRHGRIFNKKNVATLLNISEDTALRELNILLEKRMIIKKRNWKGNSLSI